MAAPSFDTYDEFFPFYVAAHSKRVTRLVHAVSTLTGLVVAVASLVTQRPLGLLVAVLVGYGGAWASHFLLQRNIPATFGHVAWSLRGDRQMIGMILRGRDAELQSMADAYLSTASPDRLPPSLSRS